MGFGADQVPAPAVPVPAWMVPPARPAPKEGAPAWTPPIDGMPLFVTFGVIGGLFIGKAMVDHLFVEGTTDEERKGIFWAIGGALAIWGLHSFTTLDARWYDLEAWGQEQEQDPAQPAASP